MELLKLILIIFPFLTFIYLLIIKRKSLLFVSLLFCLQFLLLSVIIWQIKLPYLANSFLKGFYTSADIFLIIIGALIFIDLLQKNRIIHQLIIYLQSISADYRIQVILLCWFLENFIEGIAGFGTPATIVAPILLTLGFKPITAVILTLLGNSTSVAFGAAGTPIRTGFAAVFQPQIPTFTALLSFTGILVPVFMIWVATRGRIGQNNHFLSALPFALWSGLIYVFSSLFSLNFGPEFPSIIGSLIGLFIIIASIKFKLFTPPTIIPFGHLSQKTISTISLPKTFLPYLLIIIFLVITKFFLKTVNLPLLDNQTHLINLANPGISFIITILILLISKKYRASFSFSIIKNSFTASVSPLLIIFAMATTVQFLSLTSQNNSGLTSIMDTLIKPFSNILIFFWAPFLGAFGSFITGSATVSNIMFGQFLDKIAITLGKNSAFLLSLQLAGAAVGNMIALADMLVAQTVAGLKNHEAPLLKKLVPPCFIIIIITAIVGLVLNL